MNKPPVGRYSVQLLYATLHSSSLQASYFVGFINAALVFCLARDDDNDEICYSKKKKKSVKVHAKLSGLYFNTGFEKLMPETLIHAFLIYQFIFFCGSY